MTIIGFLDISFVFLFTIFMSENQLIALHIKDTLKYIQS